MARYFRTQNEYEKELVDLIDGLCHSRQRWQVWQDLITAMACSLSNVADRTPGRFEKREKEYEDCIKRLGSVEVAGHAFAIVVMALDSNPDQDFLGSMYMRLELGNHWTGQFFTPYCISKMMAQISMQGVKEQVEEHGWISVCDPCIGGGAMLVAAANMAKENEVNYQNHMLFVGQDIDRIVGMMAYIQLSILGCPGYIAIANTITNPITGHALFPDEREGQEFWYTPFFFKQEWNMRRQILIFENLMRKNVKKSQIHEEKSRKEEFTFFFDFDKGEMNEMVYAVQAG